MSKVHTGLQKAISTAGGLEPMAAKLRITQKVLRQWLKDDGADVPEVTHNADLERAIELAGGPAALGRELGVTHQSVCIYRKQGYMPAPHAQHVELRYGIPRGNLVSPKLRNAMGVGGDL